VFYYAPVVVVSPELKFRIQKAVVSVDVLPSLHISTLVSASLTASNEYIVAGNRVSMIFFSSSFVVVDCLRPTILHSSHALVSVRNPTYQPIHLQRLALISQAWSACRLENAVDDCHYRLMPAHTAQV
jgi:hypothetical protein